MQKAKMAKNVGVTELTNSTFSEFTKEGVVLVDFSAEWCMPCVMMGPIFDELSQKFKGKMKFGKVDIEENQTIAQKFNVSSIPNFILFKNGEIVDQYIGSMSEEDFEKKLKKFI